jgi:glucose/arabinose dehydrogenase
MLRNMLLAAAVGIGISATVAWHVLGPFNGPRAAALPLDQWEALLHKRIAVPEGYSFTVHARDLGQPRLMQMTDTGDLIVSGYRDGTIMLVRRDGDGDGRSDGQIVLGAGLDNPHGLLLEGSTLFVAEEHRVVKYDFDGRTLDNERVVLRGIPQGGHSSRTLKRGPDGWLYLSIGSSCNACLEDHSWRAAIIRFKEDAAPELFASGLRNSVGFDWQPETGALIGVDNGRDNLGDDVPDDEVNRIEAGRHYGWPFLHGAGVEDPGLFTKMPAGIAPIPQAHGLGAHVAPLSIVFLEHQPDLLLNGSALVAEHGSWNRSVKAGYRIVRLTFQGSSIREEVFMSGCELAEEVICRPVDILEAADGSLYVTDDYAGAIYRIARQVAN